MLGSELFSMKIFLFILTICFSINLLTLIVKIFIDLWGEIMSVKNRKVIRHWDWLITMGYEEAALIILKKIKQ